MHTEQPISLVKNELWLKKMIGKKVQVSLQEGEDIHGVVSKIIDEETFLIQDLDTHDFIEASIFDIRSS